MRIDVDSSLIVWVDYFAAENRLQLAFHSGEIYDYAEVPPAVYHGLLSASSKGRYFNQHIRDSFPSQRLRRFVVT